jgi:cysteine synthase A
MANILDTIGNTPLIKLQNISKEINCNIFAKCEFLNPAGSIKDRVALAMVEDAITNGKLKGKHIVEPTSGNTGIGLAFVCAIKGIKLTIVMPESMSKERRDAIKHYGAELILTKAELGMQGAIQKAQELVKSSNAIMLDQFENSANPKAHYQSTAPEIANALDCIDIFIASVGTGGTLSGIGKYLKEQKNSQVIAIEPSESAVISGKEKGLHKIEGIGAGFIPKNLDLSIVDKTIEVSSEDAINMAKELAKKEALFIGISSGANVAAIYNLAKEQNIANKTIATILPDSACRYQSTELFN